MNSSEIRKRFIDFFVKVSAQKNLAHVEVPSSSLIPENHPTLLFTNSGMVQFTPYFLGIKNPETDFKSKRLCSVQKCIRTGDLDIVGTSKYHLTFFEMLGSWSIGDYGKKTAVELAFDLLTNKEYGFGLDASRFYPTVFEGNDEAPFDAETYEAWKNLGIPEEKISKLPASENWWAPGPVGPCGPCTEVLYDRGPEFGPEEKIPGMTDNPRYLEIWNAGVFMQYNRQPSGQLEPLKALSVDTGAGLERFAVLLQKVDSVYETDIFAPIISKLTSLSIDISKTTDSRNKSGLQRVADHMRAATFLMAEGLFPSNKDQGYVLRRLIRKSCDECMWHLSIEPNDLTQIMPIICDMFKDYYPELKNVEQIQKILEAEIVQYKTVAESTKKYIQRNFVSKSEALIKDPFNIYQSVGASKDLIAAIATSIGIEVDFSDFDEKLKEHQEKSKSNMGQRFKGGLGEHSEQTTKYHTATHLLHKALREVLGEGVQQMGSNITPERLRFDFSYPEKMTPDQINKVEQIVNEKIKESLPVNKIQLTKDEAEKTGAFHFFKEKYADLVTIYYTGNDIKTAWTKEFCGGPHVSNTSEIGQIKIVKEESVAKGIRRIKAV